MVKVYAGVDSIKLSPKTATSGFESDYRETTIKKFGTASFKPAGNGITTSGGGLHRQAYNFNQSSKDFTRQYRQTGFFDVTETSEQDNSYAWDCWFYLNSSSSGTGNGRTPSIFSWDGPRSSSGSNRSYELRVISDSELKIQLCEGFSQTDISGSINASLLGETDFLDQWIWVAFQKTPDIIGSNPASKYEFWIGKSGTAFKPLTSTQRLLFVPGISLDQYRVGATGVGGGTPQFTPIDGYIDEVAVRKGAPFSGTVTCPTSEYTGDEDGMLELYHYSSATGQLYTNSGNGVDSSDNGSNINGFFDSYLQTYNPLASSTDISEYAGTRLGSITTVEENNANYPIQLNTNFAGIALGNINTEVNEPVSLTGISLTSSLSSVGAGLGVLVPVTQLTANASLGSVNIPVIWSKIQTGITTNWKEVDTG
jgi:hypothetical protein